MTQKITLKIWNNQEQKVTKIVEVDNVLSIRFESVIQSILFFRNHTEIIINPKYHDIEFSFSSDKSKVFIYITEAEY